MRLATDPWRADENDYVNLVYIAKRNSSSKRYEMSKWSFDNATLVTD